MKNIFTLIIVLICIGSSAQTTLIPPNDNTTPIGSDETNYSYSFTPEPGKYVLSGWVKEDVVNPISYEHSNIQVTYGNETSVEFSPSGSIIDGWQRIQGIFTIPVSALEFKLTLRALDDEVVCFFDDIRVVPFNGNMKSFVYDPITQRLMAELDENNYATFYEYDQEGGLVRVKKETAKGIKTIQETRSGNAQNND